MRHWRAALRLDPVAVSALLGAGAVGVAEPVFTAEYVILVMPLGGHSLARVSNVPIGGATKPKVRCGAHLPH